MSMLRCFSRSSALEIENIQVLAKKTNHNIAASESLQEDPKKDLIACKNENLLDVLAG